MKTLEQQWPKHKIFINHCLKIDKKKKNWPQCD